MNRQLPRRRISQGFHEPPPEPELVVRRAEASAKIQERIHIGKEIRQRRIDTADQLEAARRDRRRWSDFTAQLLTQLFTTHAVADDFLAFHGGQALPWPPSLYDELESFSEDLDHTINQLESIYERLEGGLYPERTPSEGPAAERRDPTTNLWAREVFDADFPEHFAQAARAHQPLSLILIDIDHFKSVNDKNGHQVGDAVLEGVAAAIAAVAEGKGKAYRYGGEEIIVVLRNYTPQEASGVAERMRVEVEKASPSGIPVTASFGVSAYPDHAEESKHLFKAADAAMYDAKNSGRNQVRVYARGQTESG